MACVVARSELRSAHASHTFLAGQIAAARAYIDRDTSLSPQQLVADNIVAASRDAHVKVEPRPRLGASITAATHRATNEVERRLTDAKPNGLTLALGLA